MTYEEGNPGGPGRPSVITNEVIAEVADGVRVGLPFHGAAIAAGISAATFYGWQDRGQRYLDADEPDEEDEPYARFLETLTRARWECARGDAMTLAKASTEGLAETIEKDMVRSDKAGVLAVDVTRIRRPDWRAAESRLKRRFRDDWGDAQKLDHQGEVQIPLISIEGGLPHVKPREGSD